MRGRLIFVAIHVEPPRWRARDVLLLAAPSRYLCSLHLAKLNASLSINFSSLLQETAPFSPREQSGELDSTVSLSLAGHVHTIFSPLVILLHYFKNPRRSCDFLWPVYSQVLTQYPMRQITVDCPKRTTKKAVAVGLGASKPRQEIQGHSKCISG